MFLLVYTKIGGVKRDIKKHKESYRIIGKNIRAKRKVLNFSQEELAFRINSARNYIGCIERGEKVPSVTILLDIAETLNCSLCEITDGV